MHHLCLCETGARGRGAAVILSVAFNTAFSQGGISFTSSDLDWPSKDDPEALVTGCQIHDISTCCACGVCVCEFFMCRVSMCARAPAAAWSKSKGNCQPRALVLALAG